MTRITLVYLLLGIGFIILTYCLFRNCSLRCYPKDEKFSHADQEVANLAAKELEEMLARGEEPPEVDENEFVKYADQVLIMKMQKGVENLMLHHPVNSTYWPYHYYSRYYPPGGWPEGLYSRLYHWSPGFYTTSNWMWRLRPGLSEYPVPRARWIRHNSQYYYINNDPSGMTENYHAGGGGLATANDYSYYPSDKITHEA